MFSLFQATAYFGQATNVWQDERKASSANYQ
jgi:hypothetical protein